MGCASASASTSRWSTRSRRALPGVLAGIPPPDATQGRHRAICEVGDAPSNYADRRDAAKKRRGRWPDLRNDQYGGATPALHRCGHRPAAGGQCLRCNERPDPAGAAGLHCSTPTSISIPRRRRSRKSRSLPCGQIAAFGLEPKVALLSHSNFGIERRILGAENARRARAAARADAGFEVDGEMHGDCALDDAARNAVMPESALARQCQPFGMPQFGQCQYCL